MTKARDFFHIDPTVITEEEFKEEQEKIIFDYSTTKMPERYYGADFSEYPNNITDKLKQFAIDPNGIVVIEGPNGTGKTYSACSCFGYRVEKGLVAGQYISCKYQLGPLIRSSRLTTGRQNEIDTMEFYYKAPFLVIDEAGKCEDKVLERNFLNQVISARYDNMKPTVICTNLTMKELCDFLGEDINSRFHEVAKVLTLDGNDWRKA